MVQENLKLRVIYLPLFFILCLNTFHHNGKIANALNENAEKQALLYFKLAITSDPENILQSWNDTVPHCTWFGISCTQKNQRVISINLPDLSLSGTLSPHLSNLTALETLNLTKNSFSGRIPPEFGFLRSLRYLAISMNLISGSIPPSLSNCLNLRVISLSFNELTGHLPPQLGSLKELKMFNASANNLTGFIPPTFGNLSSLSTLCLARNKLYGSIPKEISRLDNLVKIQLSDNKFSGEIPKTFFNFSSLAYLSLAKNNFSGTLPSNIAYTLPNIKQLYLGGNSFGGRIPESFSNLTRIEFVDLSSNQFEGPLPLIGNTKRLVYLNLGNNMINSTTTLNFKFFDSLKNSTRLESLDLFSNELSGELPISIANMSSELVKFCIEDNYFTGSLPGGLENFQNLISLSVEENEFSGQIPLSIGSLKNLQRLSLHHNMLSGPIPDIFGNLTELFKLTLGGNDFLGKIPDSISGCKQLTILYLWGSNLSGRVPDEISRLVSLNYLDLSDNSFHGPVPIGKMKHLEVLDVSGNNFSGSLPDKIHHCVSMNYLNVSRNNFVGSIPKSLENLVGLEYLDLSQNNFSGPIPSDLENLRMLKILDLSFNKLEGEVPEKGIFSDLEWNSTQGNYKLCGNKEEFATKLRIPICIVNTNKPNTKKHLSLKTIILVVSLATFASVISCLAFLFVFRKRRTKTKTKVGTIISPLARISYADIQLATNGFSSYNMIGKGSFGSVYKAAFGTQENDDFSTLAIKVIDLKQSKASKTFKAECEALRNIRHRNIVKVITSCSSIYQNGDEFKAIIMEFMSNGSLDNWLYPNEGQPWLSLDFEQRLNIAIDVACALDYLHHDCEPPIVHCDLKPSNILLDEDMGAHVGDFGLARFLLPNTHENISATMDLKGSIGYICPEYGLGSNVSTKGDVYSFGIILLELILGKRPTDKMFEDGLNLNTFASTLSRGQVLSIVDDMSFGDTNSTEWKNKIEECVAKIVKIGLSCTCDSAWDRVTMRDALTKLQEVEKFYKA